jgi:ubiquinone/menaquinone biosynthesis C-methylase UbiE
MSKDLFSKQSDLYARYRPGYPSALIEYILPFVKGFDSSWDCATGNGQAALLLATYFKTVHATDISEKQIANAIQHPRIRYSTANAEFTLFEDSMFDLITVAQAYHWLDFKKFEQEVKRVSKSNGIIAVWGYSSAVSEYSKLNSLVNSFYQDIVGPYWDDERKYVDEHYRSIPFPFDEVPAREFIIEKHWSLEDLCGYLNTWSSVQHFIKANQFNPVDRLKENLKNKWPNSDFISFRFPLFVRIGKVIK